MDWRFPTSQKRSGVERKIWEALVYVWGRLPRRSEESPGQPALTGLAEREEAEKEGYH